MVPAKTWSRLRRVARHASLMLAVCCYAAALVGCGSTGSGPGMSSFAQVMPVSSGPTVAFESIDGPPPQVFDRLVTALNAESVGKPITIVSREGGAGYRVRAYLSAQVRRGRAVIAWVFDAYDGNQERALRLSGEEVAGKAGQDAWAAADDQLMRRIAQAGINGLTGYLTGRPAPESPAEPSQGGSVIASADGSGTPAAEPSSRALGFSSH